MPALLNYIGGKNKLAPSILKVFPEKFDSYTEPFCGSATLLFKLPKPATIEVLNDINRNIINFFKVLQVNGKKFQKFVKGLPYNYELFYEYKEVLKNPGDEFEQAVAFWYVSNTFGRRVSGTSPAWTFKRRVDSLEKFSNR